MNDEDVVRLCGEPRSTKYESGHDAWNYGDITIIFDQSNCDSDIVLGLVIKGVRTADLNRYGFIDDCRNILGTLYSK